MKKIISFSLWGNSPKYTLGAIKNAKLAPEVYPGWTPRFYIHKDVVSDVTSALKDLEAEVVIFDSVPNWGASLYRLLPINDQSAERIIFRDCDSRLSEREAKAVKAWEDSQMPFHIMRDHPYHGGFPILAGMFGCIANVITDVDGKIKKNLEETEYHTDQQFILEHVWPLAKFNSIFHDEIFSANPFPTSRVGLEYVGEPVDENDNPCEAIHRIDLKQYLKL